MKKVLFIAALAVIALVSCNKDRTCTCTTSSTQPGDSTIVEVTDYNGTKAAAKSACALSANAMGRRKIWSQTDHHDAVVGPPAVAAYTTTKTCELK